MNIVSNARKKLTLFYLAILMLISISFSIAFYNVSLREVRRGLNRPNRPLSMFVQGLQDRPVGLSESIDLEREQILQEVKERLIGRLLLINAVVFVGGGLLCSYLAKKTLDPVEDAHRRLEKFTADASHELRTPLAAIRMENEVALSDQKLSAKTAKEVIKSTIEEVDKMTVLTSNLLSLARIDSSELQKTEVKVAKVIERAVSRAKNTHHDNVIIESHVDKDLVLNIDESMIEQVLFILIDNAIKYGVDHPAITIQAKNVRGRVRLVVSDNGVGIAKEHLAHVFDRFYRADTARSRTKIQGHGLGLSIAKDIIEKHGGKIAIESQAEKGTEAIIELPLED